MVYIICGILVILAFYGGVITGIADCKRRFGIPKGVTPEFLKRFHHEKSVIVSADDLCDDLGDDDGIDGAF